MDPLLARPAVDPVLGVRSFEERREPENAGTPYVIAQGDVMPLDFAENPARCRDVRETSRVEILDLDNPGVLAGSDLVIGMVVGVGAVRGRVRR
jgi:hypothetical protein